MQAAIPLQHKSVLLDEAVDALVTRTDGVYVDGTFGRGGHARRLLERLSAEARLIAFDRDPCAGGIDPLLHLHEFFLEAGQLLLVDLGMQLLGHGLRV